MASWKNTLSSIIVIIAAIGLAVRFLGSFLQLATFAVKAPENERNPRKEKD